MIDPAGVVQARPKFVAGENARRVYDRAAKIHRHAERNVAPRSQTEELAATREVHSRSLDADESHMFTWPYPQSLQLSKMRSMSALSGLGAVLVVSGGCASGERESAGASEATTGPTAETDEPDGPTTSTTGAGSTGSGSTAGTTTSTTASATSGTTSDPTEGPVTSAPDTTTNESGGDAVCGNGVPEGDEECDDGNADDIDNCSNACQLPKCGDGVRAGVEECDDGNAARMDGNGRRRGSVTDCGS